MSEVRCVRKPSIGVGDACVGTRVCGGGVSPMLTMVSLVGAMLLGFNAGDPAMHGTSTHTLIRWSRLE